MDVSNADLSRSFIRPMSETDAQELHSHLHYLRSPRKDSCNLGLYVRDPKGRRDLLLGLVTVSDCDVDSLSSFVGMDISNIGILSRLIIVPGAPKNSGSRLLGKAIEWFRYSRPEICSLVTYNNPNLGFAGTLYKAANWEFLATEEKKPDMLLDGRYVTLRALKHGFGSFDYHHLVQELNERLVILPRSQFALEVYGYQIQSRRHFSSNRKSVRFVEHEGRV